MKFIASTLTQNHLPMSRQSRNNERDQKSEYIKRDAAEASRYVKDHRDQRIHSGRNDNNNISGLNRHRLNDLYERSSI